MMHQENLVTLIYNIFIFLRWDDKLEKLYKFLVRFTCASIVGELRIKPNFDDSLYKKAQDQVLSEFIMDTV